MSDRLQNPYGYPRDPLSLLPPFRAEEMIDFVDNSGLDPAGIPVSVEEGDER